jgi:hypothetical protein
LQSPVQHGECSSSLQQANDSASSVFDVAGPVDEDPHEAQLLEYQMPASGCGVEGDAAPDEEPGVIKSMSLTNDVAVADGVAEASDVAVTTSVAVINDLAVADGMAASVMTGVVEWVVNDLLAAATPAASLSTGAGSGGSCYANILETSHQAMYNMMLQPYTCESIMAADPSSHAAAAAAHPPPVLAAAVVDESARTGELGEQASPSLLVRSLQVNGKCVNVCACMRVCVQS